MQPDKIPSKLRKLLLSSLVIAAIAVPAIALNHSSINIQGMHFGQSHFTLRTLENSKISVLVHGKVRFNSEETSVAQVTNSVSIIEKRDGQIWRTDFYLDKDKKLQQRYWHNDVEQAFDGEGRRWLASVVPQLAREDSANAGVRAARIYASGGATALFKEIAEVKSGQAKSRYIDYLLAQGPLDAAGLTQVLQELDKIDSDWRKSKILRNLLANQKLDAASQVLLLTASKDIDSDYERANLLKSLTPQLSSDAKVAKAWQESVAGMESDFEVRGVIQSIARLTKPEALQIGAALNASQGIDSDFELRSALASLAPHLKLAPEQLPAQYIQRSRGIDSDFERRVSLITLLETNKLSNADYERLFDSTAEMNSDFEISQVLIMAARDMPNEPRLLERYRAVSQDLGQDTRATTERALNRKT